MRIDCTAQEGHDEASLQGHFTLSPGEVVVIMVKARPNGKPVVESYEPLTIDDHPDTLREIGGRVVMFAEDES